jgi:hypothetical protein
MSDPIHSITIQDDTTPEVVATIEVSPPAGNDGWSPVFAVVTDGARRVLQVSDWVGGEGAKPATGKYVGASGLVDAVGDGVDIRGPQGAQGATGSTGATGAAGADGNDGWTPVFAVVTDGTRRVLQVSDWVGGEGTKPATGKYVGASGLVDAVGDGVDIRGATGPQGDPGDAADIAAEINNATEKTTPADNDRFGMTDSADSYGLKWLSWANIKATLKSWLEALTDLTLKRLSIAQGSISTAASALGISATWNNNAETFHLDDGDVTDTASAAGSTLLRRRVGSENRLTLAKDGALQISSPSGSTAALKILWQDRNFEIAPSVFGDGMQIREGNLTIARDGPALRFLNGNGVIRYGYIVGISAGVIALQTDSAGASLEFSEMTAPGEPPANAIRLWAEDDGSGNTRVMMRRNGSAAQEIFPTFNGVRLIAGSGSPEGVVSAPVGTIYSRTDGGTGTSVYLKESGTGNTGWVAVASGGGGGGNWELLSTTTISGTPGVVDIPITGANRKYMIELDRVYPSSNGYDLRMRTSTDGGSTFADGSNNYYFGYGPQATFAPAQNGNTFCPICPVIGNTKDKAAIGRIYLHNPHDTDVGVRWAWEVTRQVWNSANVDVFFGTGYRAENDAVDTLRFYFDVGNIGGGVIRLFGWSE